MSACSDTRQFGALCTGTQIEVARLSRTLLPLARLRRTPFDALPQRIVLFDTVHRNDRDARRVGLRFASPFAARLIASIKGPEQAAVGLTLPRKKFGAPSASSTT